MASITISETLKDELLKFIKKNKKADLITTYLLFLEKKFNIRPVLFIRDKTIFQSQEELIKNLEAQNKLWRETEIKIQYGQQRERIQGSKIFSGRRTSKYQKGHLLCEGKIVFATLSRSLRELQQLENDLKEEHS